MKIAWKPEVMEGGIIYTSRIKELGQTVVFVPLL